ncbi:LPD23 domain-containing protein, partial [Campylobacter felis]|uniref:ADP-ribosyltransferase-containing protein n=1 Tax=Campylobacter felis TaxID=2974565 RepID=UPI0025685781|nr:hypothetical protein [Campylobacter felis]
ILKGQDSNEKFKLYGNLEELKAWRKESKTKLDKARVNLSKIDEDIIPQNAKNEPMKFLEFQQKKLLTYIKQNTPLRLLEHKKEFSTRDILNFLEQSALNGKEKAFLIRHLERDLDKIKAKIKEEESVKEEVLKSDLLDKTKPLRKAEKEELTNELLEQVQKENLKLYLNHTNENLTHFLKLEKPLKITMRGANIKHILNKHGENSTPAKNGQPFVSLEDIKNYDEYINNADKQILKENDKGEKTLLSGKQINGYYIVISSVRLKNGELKLKTMYKENGKLENNEAFKGVKLPSETPSVLQGQSLTTNLDGYPSHADEIIAQINDTLSEVVDNYEHFCQRYGGSLDGSLYLDDFKALNKDEQREFSHILYTFRNYLNQYDKSFENATDSIKKAYELDILGQKEANDILKKANPQRNITKYVENALRVIKSIKASKEYGDDYFEKLQELKDIENKFYKYITGLEKTKNQIENIQFQIQKANLEKINELNEGVDESIKSLLDNEIITQQSENQALKTTTREIEKFMQLAQDLQNKSLSKNDKIQIIDNLVSALSSLEHKMPEFIEEIMKKANKATMPYASSVDRAKYKGFNASDKYAMFEAFRVIKLLDAYDDAEKLIEGIKKGKDIDFNNKIFRKMQNTEKALVLSQTQASLGVIKDFEKVLKNHEHDVNLLIDKALKLLGDKKTQNAGAEGDLTKLKEAKEQGKSVAQTKEKEASSIASVTSNYNEPMPHKPLEDIIPQQSINLAMEKFHYDEKKAKDLLEWHKDSHALTKDENDLPKVFYHGSGARFQVFKKEFDKGKTGFWFADRKIIAEDFAKDKGGKAIYPVFLKMKNPIWLTYQKEGDKWVFDWLDDEGKALLKEAKNQGLSIDYFQKDFKFKEFLESKGYDGIVLKTKLNGNLRHSVFDSNQIKHIDNKGSFTDKKGNITKNKPKNSEAEHKYFNENSENIYYSNPHIGAGLLGGSLNGIEQDEEGNLSFDPAKFAAGFLGANLGSKAVSRGIEWRANKVKKAYPNIAKNNPVLMEQIAKRDLLTYAKNESANALTRFLNKNKHFDIMKGIFAGEKALLNEAYAPHKARLVKAKELENKGADEIEIWEKTGWYKDKDKKWKFEISQRGGEFDFLKLTFESSNYHYLKLKEVLQDKELFQAYPELQNLEIVAGNIIGSKNLGEYHQNNKLITLNTLFIKREIQAKSTLYHEIQHAIQDIEGFAYGEHLSMYSKDNYRLRHGEVEARNVENRLDNAYIGDIYTKQSLKDEIQDIKDAILIAQDDPEIAQLLGEKLEKYEKKYQNLGEHDIYNTRRHPHKTMDTPLSETIAETTIQGEALSKELENKEANTHTLREQTKKFLSALVGKNITNQNDGRIASISRKNIAKMTSDKAIAKSVNNGFSEAEHFEAVGDIENLYQKAILKQTHGDAKSNNANVLFHRYNADFKGANALITLKESLDKNTKGNKIYTLELEALELKPAAPKPLGSEAMSRNTGYAEPVTPTETLNESIAQKSENIYQSNTHLGAGLLGGSLGSKAVRVGFKHLEKNPALKEKIITELADTLEKGFEKAREKYPLLSTLEPRYIVQNERGRKIQAKVMLKNLLKLAEKESQKMKLKAHKTLKKYNVDNLEIAKEQEYRDFIANVWDKKDYEKAPNILKIAKLAPKLKKALGLEFDEVFLTKKDLSHFRTARKANYNQALSEAEMLEIPSVITHAKNAYIDTRHKNFFIVFADKKDNAKINFIHFNADELGNYIITTKKADKKVLNDKHYKQVGSGIEPHIP